MSSSGINGYSARSAFKLCASLLAAVLLVLGAGAAKAAPSEVVCGNGNDLPVRELQPPDQPDLKVTGTCVVRLGADRHYFYSSVNILGGGELRFRESDSLRKSQTDFWASSIIIENDGAMTADGGGPDTPFGSYGGTLTIHLYGKNEAVWNPVDQKFDKENLGAVCKSETPAPCGIPQKTWDDNGQNKVNLPGQSVADYFYQYGPLRGDGRCTDGSVFRIDRDGKGVCDTATAKVGYFGNKVLAVSYGGTLKLAGYKGATYDARDKDPLNSGWSWMRLADGNSLKRDDTSLILERDPAGKWAANDEIVVTTTDYLPGHSEKLAIDAGYTGGATVGVRAVESPTGKIQWPHNGTRYGGPNDAENKRWAKQGQPSPDGRLPNHLQVSMDWDLVKSGAETRAAVALLTRSIQIVSAGDTAGQALGPTDYYGAHMVVRQGFKQVQITGVEFRQMGQGGRLGHYPVHFHMARRTPPDTYVKDSSVNESMTRWFVLHSTQGVRLARNVGYKSIGHGFYLEDGTETDNELHSNIGINARAAIANDTYNPRRVPGILADNQDPAAFVAPNVKNQGFPYRSDVENPSVFWITNGWNDFIGNMAAGAGACGAAYWLVPAANMNMTDVPAGNAGQMQWSGYAALQKERTWAGTTPLKSFYKNYATSAMNSFQTTSDAPDCGDSGVVAADVKPGNYVVVQAVRSIAPKPVRHTVTPPPPAPAYAEPDNYSDHYYPHVLGGARRATYCPNGDSGPDCSNVPPCANGAAADRCAVTVIDHFTTAFHWAHGNYAAIWLRPQWYLLTNSVISDVQNGGLTFVSGGDYTHSSIIEGYWALARNSVFIGNTNDNDKFPFASNIGPFNAASGLKCDTSKDGDPAYCLNANEGISMPTVGFFTNQRLANIYDGPSYQDSNAYLDITTANCPHQGLNGPCMYGTGNSVLRLKKTPGSDDSQCYLPNAAIAWKQPNGFYYPPAFHTTNLFFDNVDLRHYVIDPLFKDGTYLTDDDAVSKQYCTGAKQIFDNWTSIDRQTELNDDDGSLTGLTNSIQAAGPIKQTISINEDSFFSAPVETAECASSLGVNSDAANACKPPDPQLPPMTARTSPYDYVATVVYHKSADGNKTDLWDTDCANPSCYGVPLFRQYLTGTKDTKGPLASTREWQRWYERMCEYVPQRDSSDCRWPFIRMAGSNFSQRETLTINSGLYYLDTTVSAERQRKEDYTKIAAAGRQLNVFKAAQTYYMFFVYAKSTTRQAYQIYVGTDFDQVNGLKPVQVSIDTTDLQFTPFGSVPGWLTWDYSQVKSTGILVVTVDFKDVPALDPTPAHGLCQPRTFCKPKPNPKAGDKLCESALADGDRLKAESDAVCGNWAVKDLDCTPIVKDNAGKVIGGGCYGFSFTLPAGFRADNSNHRPTPASFPVENEHNLQGHPDWTTKFLNTTKAPDATGGRCFYPKLPGTPGTGCPVP
jgi:cell migration-inducing and hyaluronan-binding protein